MVKNTGAAKSPRGVKQVVAGFFDALGGFPDAEQAALGAASLAKIKETIAATKAKAAAVATKEKTRVRAAKVRDAAKAAKLKAATKATKPAKTPKAKPGAPARGTVTKGVAINDAPAAKPKKLRTSTARRTRATSAAPIPAAEPVAVETAVN